MTDQSRTSSSKGLMPAEEKRDLDAEGSGYGSFYPQLSFGSTCANSAHSTKARTEPNVIEVSAKNASGLSHLTRLLRL